MKTTEVFVEQVLIGFLVLAVGIGIYWPELKTLFDASSKWVTGGVLVGTAYLVGMLYDRVADTLLETSDHIQRLGLAVEFSDVYPNANDPFPEDQFRQEMLDCPEAQEQVAYLRSRIRLTRSLATLIPALSVSLLVYLLDKDGVTDSLRNQTMLGLIVVYVGLFVLLLLARPKQPRTDAGPDKIRRYLENVGSASRPKPTSSGTPSVITGIREKLICLLRRAFFEPMAWGAILVGGLGTYVSWSAQGKWSWIPWAGIGVAGLTVWVWWRISKTFRVLASDHHRFLVAKEDLTKPLKMSVREVEKYLKETRLALPNAPSVRVVMGNQASDLDSMVSAIIFAFLTARDGSHADELIVPLMNMPADDFRLRTEAVFLFNKVGIDADLLFFKDSPDIDLDSLAKEQRLHLILVDHNVLAPDQKQFEELVDEIIDHHKNQKECPQALRTIDETVGSTVTLIAERLVHFYGVDKVDEGLATLMLGTILLDTANLTPKRTSSKDKAIVAALKRRVRTDTLFDELKQEKFNTRGLSAFDLLRKDYKEWSAGFVRYGISSVPGSAAKWAAENPGLEETFGKYAVDRKLQVLIAMNYFEEQSFRRDLIIWTPLSDLRQKLIDGLSDAGVDLRPIPTQGQSTEDFVIRFFHQNNPDFSRKKLQPVLERIFLG